MKPRASTNDYGPSMGRPLRFKGDYERHYERMNPLDERDFLRSFMTYRRMYVDLLPNNKRTRILDLACGPGHFLHFLVKMGYANHLGVDRSPEFVEFVTKNITSEVVQNDVFVFVEETDEKFDVIVMNDFIEHVPKSRIRALVSSVRELCTDYGRVIIKTVNMAFPLSGYTRYSDLTHEIGYTEESITHLLNMCGFDAIRVNPAGPRHANAALRVLSSPFFIFLGQQRPRILTPNLIAIADITH